MILLKVSGLAKSVYYYTLSKKDKDVKNKEIIDKIKEIFINNKERYGYRRITLELRNQGCNINHKKVYRLMVKLGLKPLKRNKRKYSSYKGTVGKIADNLIESGKASKDGDSIVIDVTELGYDKVLAKGKITKSFIISAPQFSASAIEKIEEMGGEAIEL